MKLFSLQGEVALITGASRGIGLEIANAFAEAGATVVLAARDGQRLKAACESIVKSGGRAEPYILELSDDAALVAAVADVVGRHGAVDILVNNAGVMPIQPLLK